MAMNYTMSLEMYGNGVMIGFVPLINVWEWCDDWFCPTYHLKHSAHNPRGPEKGSSKSMRGGSYLCHKSYCNRYRVAARSSNTPDSSTGNIGFRCEYRISLCRGCQLNFF